MDKTLFTKNAARLTLQDGREITINSADKFSYNVGGNVTDGTKGTDLTFTEFAATFGVDDVLNSSSKIQDNKNILEQSFQSPLKEARERFEKEYLTNQLKKHHGNISKTADFIGMERSALHRKLKSLGIKGIN